MRGAGHDAYPPLLTEIGGSFAKIALATEAGLTLSRGRPDRPPARFNRPGQDALCLSPDEDSARVAIGPYVRPDDPPRVLLRFEVGRCRPGDLRDPGAAEFHETGRQPWHAALDAGQGPPPWIAADAIRSAGHSGLIDPSRRRPGLWHITLFRWNAPGAPSVRPTGDPVPITVTPDYR